MIKRILIGILICSLAAGAALLAIRYGKPLFSLFSKPGTESASPDTPDKQASAGTLGALESDLVTLCRNLESDSSDITVTRQPGERTVEIRAKIPRGRPFEQVAWSFSRAAEGTGYRLSDCSLIRSSQTCVMQFTSSRAHRDRIKFSFSFSNRYYSKLGRIAFFIEDFGFEADQTTLNFLNFSDPLTIGLVPEKGKSDWTAKIARQYHKEIVIQLPMEPLVPLSPPYNGQIIMVHHTTEQIDALINSAAKYIQGFSGFSNLYGSRALQDSRITRIVLEDAKQHHSYFIDTRTTDKSQAPDIAASIGIPCREIDGRIPKKASEKATDSLLTVYMNQAQKTGAALVACSPTGTLIKSLTKNKALFKRNGIALVYASDLVEKPIAR